MTARGPGRDVGVQGPRKAGSGSPAESDRCLEPHNPVVDVVSWAADPEPRDHLGSPLDSDGASPCERPPTVGGALTDNGKLRRRGGTRHDGRARETLGLQPPRSIHPWSGTDGAVTMSVRRDIERRLTAVPGLTPRDSRYGHGLAFYVGRREVVHFHGEDRMDVRLTAEVIQRRTREGRFDARVTPEGGVPNWVKVRVFGPRDVALAVVLAQEAVRANAPSETNRSPSPV